MEEQINFDDFSKKFYSNVNNEKMNIGISIEDATNESPITIYDIHMMLLDLLINGTANFNLDIINDLDNSILFLQKFFNNIAIKINIVNYTQEELIEKESEYENRYLRFNTPDKMTLNGKHIKESTLDLIKSFYLINEEHNLCISFKIDYLKK